MENKEAKWLNDLKEEMVKLKQQNVVINENKVKKQCSKFHTGRHPTMVLFKGSG